jgi:glutamyl-tRNA synthetase
MNKDIRVRFAPSPTGPLHIGGLRTALYNYLFAKKNDGSFVLRIEDTDQNRFIPGAEEYIMNALAWCGIIPDESPTREGEFGPYRQSERKTIYAKYAQELLKAGDAYYAFDSVEELDMARKKMAEQKGQTFQYNSGTRGVLKNSLTLSDDQTMELIDGGTPHVIRLKVPEGESIVLNDIIRGEVTINSEEVDDKILLKSDGMPTYHLANVVDDHLMGISHVIRGEEWLPSAPFHVLLYRYLGWENTMPEFAHLPLLLKPDGKGKLSKRDGLKHGFPVFPLNWKDPVSGEDLMGFRESGFLADAFTNFLAMLGWNPGTEQEIFNMENLISEFSIERIGKAGAKFDIEKAKWFNQQYLKEKPLEYLTNYLEQSMAAENVQSPRSTNEKIAEAMRERIVYPSDIYEKSKFFFFAPENYDEKVINKKWNTEIASIIQDYANALKEHESITAEVAKETLSSVLELHNTGMGKIMPALRTSLTGEGGGPDLMSIIEILGPAESSIRINTAVARLKDKSN